MATIMTVRWRTLVDCLASLTLITGVSAPATAQQRIPINERFADVNGVRLHYLVAGKGDPVILLHGYAQTSHMWRPIIGELARTHTVVAPDLRGFDQSSKPDARYNKKTMAQDVHALAAWHAALALTVLTCRQDGMALSSGHDASISDSCRSSQPCSASGRFSCHKQAHWPV